MSYMLSLTETQKNEIVKRYKEKSITYAEICKIYNVSYSSVKVYLNKLGVIHKKEPCNTLTIEQKDEIVKLYLAGDQTCGGLGKLYGVKGHCIRSLLVSRNVKIITDSSTVNRMYKVNHDYFTGDLKTEQQAYILGMIYADGTHYENIHAFTLALQAQDKDILEKINLELESTRPIRHYKQSTANCQDVEKLSVSSKTISKRLTELGCVSNKSLILEFPTLEQVPDHLIRHFVRGYCDGDGSLGVYQNKKTGWWKLHAQFVGTEKFCLKLKEICKEKLGINLCLSIRHKERNNSTRQVVISGSQQSYKFLNWIYKDATIYLDRKYKKYNEGVAFLKNRGIKFPD